MDYIFSDKQPIEKGENGNGTYEKFESGLMICQQVLRNVAATTSATYNGEWTFPESFIDDAVEANVHVIRSSGSGYALGNRTTITQKDIVIGPNGTKMLWSFTRVSSSDSGTHDIMLTAIGRWK